MTGSHFDASDLACALSAEALIDLFDRVEPLFRDESPATRRVVIEMLVVMHARTMGGDVLGLIDAMCGEAKDFVRRTDAMRALNLLEQRKRRYDG